MKIDGYDFNGPYELGKDEVPAISGIALICSEAGEGMKILAIEYGDNLCEKITGSPNIQEWKDHAFHGTVKIFASEFDPAKRDSIAESIISRRKSSLSCQKFEAIEDDW